MLIDVGNVPPELQCKTPGCLRQRYPMNNGKGYHDYCSLTCRDSKQILTSGMKYPQRNRLIVYLIVCTKSTPLHDLLLIFNSASTPNLSSAGYGTCSLPGCGLPKYCDPANGRVHDYCGRSHAYQAQQQGQQRSCVHIFMTKGNPLVVSPVEYLAFTINVRYCCEPTYYSWD